MLVTRIPLINPTAGPLSDGVVRGRINLSSAVSAQSTLIQAANVYALHVDDGAARTITDVSTPAGDDAAADLRPWGTDTQFSAADEFWLACDGDIDEIYVKISTPGVWTGTGLSVLESIDGETLTACPSVVDDSDGLRAAAGIYRISFGSAGTRRTIAPSFGATKRKFIVLRPNGLTAKTTAPVLDRVWLTHIPSEITYTDFTASFQNDLTNGTFGNAGNFSFPLVGESTYFASPGPPLGFDARFYRRFASTRTAVWEYLASDDTWKQFTGLNDPSNASTNGPATYDGVTSELFRVRWTVPSDLTQKTITLNPTIGAVAGWWFRLRVTSVPNPGPVPVPLIRRKIRALGVGNASGIYHRLAKTYNYATYSLGAAPAANAVLNLSVAGTGQSRGLTLPLNLLESGEATGGRIDLSPPLNVPAGDQLLISSVSGEAVDAEIRLED